MCVVRTKKTQNFVIIHKGVLEDPRLSFKAKGLWTYCMSRPDDWTFMVSHLSTVSKDGEDAVYSALDELIECGYVKRVQPVVAGRFQKMDYEIYETPQIQKILPQPDFPEAVPSRAKNPALLSIEEELSNEEEVVCVPPPVGGELSRKVQKFMTNGDPVSLKYDDLIRHSIQKRKDWQLTEIDEAWTILDSYQGRVNDLDRFIEGTIENLRKIKYQEKFKKQRNECQKTEVKVLPRLEDRAPTKEQIEEAKKPGILGALFQEMQRDFEMQLSQRRGFHNQTS